MKAHWPFIPFWAIHGVQPNNRKFRTTEKCHPNSVRRKNGGFWIWPYRVYQICPICDTIKGNKSNVGNIQFWFFNINHLSMNKCHILIQTQSFQKHGLFASVASRKLVNYGIFRSLYKVSKITIKWAIEIKLSRVKWNYIPPKREIIQIIKAHK